MLKKFVFLTLGVVFSISSLVAGDGYAWSIFDQHQKVKEANSEVHIPVAEVSDGDAHYFTYHHDGKKIDFFVIQSGDGVVRAAFDACDVCFPAKKGYSQDGEFMICNNCGRRFHSSRINVVEGGCNPAPLVRRIDGDQLVIRVSDLVPGARFF